MSRKMSDEELKTKQICENMEVYARAYMDSDIEEDILETEAVVLDSINYVGRDIDYKVFYDMFRKFKVNTTEIEPNELIQELKSRLHSYYEDGIVAHIEENKDYYACTESLTFDDESAVDILNKYMNFIARTNNLDDVRRNEITHAKVKVLLHNNQKRAILYQ